MIFIVIPVFNRLDFTVKCLDALNGQRYRAFNVIVVDDGSTDGTSAHLAVHYPHVIVVPGNGNLWWTGATNLGVQKALEISTSDTDFVLTLNNDLEVKNDYLDNLLAAAHKHPRSLIGSVSVDICNPAKIHFAGTRWNPVTAGYRPALSKHITYPELVKTFDTVPTDLLPGRGVLIPVPLFREIGLFDFNNFPHYMADEDFSLRAKKMNYRLLVATKAVVYNHVSETGLKKRSGWHYYKDVLISVKSPVNLRNRWNWAKRHAGILPPVYFLVDMLRVCKGVLLKQGL